MKIMDFVKILTVVLALFQPVIIIYLFEFEFKSFSKCWNTILEPFFIVVNILTAYFFIQHRRWVISGILLIIITIFNTDLFHNIHNFFASLFFISCLYGLSEFKSKRRYLTLYCLSPIIAITFNLFWFECWSVYVLCFYHIDLILIENKFKNRHSNSK